MERRPGHGKRVQNNQKNSHVNNNNIITRVTVICLKKIQKRMIRTASMNMRGENIKPGGGKQLILLCYVFFFFLKPRQVRQRRCNSSGTTLGFFDFSLPDCQLLQLSLEFPKIMFYWHFQHFPPTINDQDSLF